MSGYATLTFILALWKVTFAVVIQLQLSSNVSPGSSAWKAQCGRHTAGIEQSIIAQTEEGAVFLVCLHLHPSDVLHQLINYSMTLLHWQTERFCSGGFMSNTFYAIINYGFCCPQVIICWQHWILKLWWCFLYVIMMENGNLTLHL